MKTNQKLQEYIINDETYYIQIDGIDDDRIYSLLDNDKNIQTYYFYHPKYERGKNQHILIPD